MDYILLLIRRFISLFFKFSWLENLLLDRNGFLYPYRSHIAPKTYKRRQPHVKRKTYFDVHFDVDLSQFMGWKIYYEIEADLLALVKSHLSPKMTIIDVGANVGFYSIHLGSFLRNGSVHAFEPDPQSFNKLLANIQLNGLTNVIINNCGLGSDRASYGLHDADKNNIGARYVSKTLKNNISLVSITTLDDYVKVNSLTSIGFIKIDIEGFEIEFLKGAKNTIKTLRPILFVEVSDINLRRSEASANELLGRLQRLRYSKYINAQSGEFVEFEQDHSDSQFDILCLP